MLLKWLISQLDVRLLWEPQFINYQSETLVICLFWFLSFCPLCVNEVPPSVAGWSNLLCTAQKRNAQQRSLLRCPASCHTETMACDAEQCFCFAFCRFPCTWQSIIGFFGFLPSDLILIIFSSSAFCHEFNVTNILSPFLKMICFKLQNRINHLCVVFTFLDLYASYLFVCHLVCSESG